jgi:hypothetical protein
MRTKPFEHRNTWPKGQIPAAVIFIKNAYFETQI